MRKYSISKTNGVPEWSAVPVMLVDCVLWEPDCDVRMTQQLCYDETTLYVRQQAKETAVRAKYTAPLSPVHEDSCMEFFFALGEDDRYFNFEINPNACIEIGFGPNRQNRIRICHKNECEAFRAQCASTTGGWIAEYQIPLDFLRLFYPDFQMNPGISFRANCYKCGDKTKHPHYLAWNSVTSETPDFHRPQDFGRICFL